MKQFFEHKAPLGEHLIKLEVLTATELETALSLQKKWGTRLGDIILAKGFCRAYDFYSALADHFNCPFVDLLKNNPEPSLLNTKDLAEYADLLVMPWKKEGNTTVLAVADPSKKVIDFSIERFGKDIDFVITSKFDIIWLLQNNADDFFSKSAVNELAERKPMHSARQVFTNSQLVGIALTCYLFVLFVCLWPVETLVVVNLLIAVFLLLNFGLRAILTWVGGDRSIDVKVTQHMVDMLDENTLPTYTILVPMYKEAEVLPALTRALRQLDYPLSKLDIKLILEEDDTDTIEAAKKLGLEGIFEIIRVPISQPKTKPKACNYALNFSRGELVTIYDAEDKPEPDQLKKVVVAFNMAPDNTVCIQSRLNYFNANENWLTRMFTLEYSLWFDFYLPALEALKIPIPLGGTSNHFKMKVLREVDAWDPYNVTEDADLGVRITQLKYRVGVVNSTTYEEENSQVGNWIRQRSRWIKGYMQTYLVHMRNPAHLYQSLGHTGFWGFQFFIGGTIISALVAPILLGLYVFWLITDTTVLNPIFPPLAQYLSLFNLLFGNGFFIYISMLGAFKRHYYSLIPYALTIPAYWVLLSIAGYKALWQLITNPFYWEKTVHGISSYQTGDEQEVEK
jgi:cellulose synthase/poly-beta-1,6-N-acetylglucosamine synthase-like glycosyltransferase